MVASAFTTTPSVTLLNRTSLIASTSKLLCPTKSRTSQPCRSSLIISRPNWFASQTPEQDPIPPSPEDEALQQELRAKVNELFGGRQNVSIDIDPDSGRAKFSVLRQRAGVAGRGASIAEADQAIERNSALTIIQTIAIVSLLTGIVFTALYYSGAVHGSNSADMRHYDMPTYGTKSYINPYELLDDDRQFQDSKQAQ